VVNGELQKAGFVMPADCLIDTKYNGLSADVIYSQLGEDPGDQGQPQQQGQGSAQSGQGNALCKPKRSSNESCGPKVRFRTNRQT
jgi:hypothetical protein